MLNKLMKSQALALASVPIRCHRVAHRRHMLNFEFEKEQAERKKAVAEVRKKHKRDYWEAQTQVENHYLMDIYRPEKIKKR